MSQLPGGKKMCGHMFYFTFTSLSIILHATRELQETSYSLVISAREFVVGYCPELGISYSSKN